MNNKIFYGAVGLVAILVLAFLAGRYYGGNVPLSGTTYLTQPGVTAFDEVASGDASIHYRKLSLASGESTTFVRNDSPFTRYVDMGALTSTGNSTATPYRVYIATTTGTANSNTAAGLPLYAVPAYAGLLNGLQLASSTQATTTSIDGRGAYSRDGIFPWRAGEYIGMVLQTVERANCPKYTGLGYCDNATSTVRGFNLDFLFRTFSTSTVR